MTVVFIVGFAIYQTSHYILVLLTEYDHIQADQHLLALKILVCSYVGCALLMAVDVYMLMIGLQLISLMA